LSLHCPAIGKGGGTRSCRQCNSSSSKHEKNYVENYAATRPETSTERQDAHKQQQQKTGRVLLHAGNGRTMTGGSSTCGQTTGSNLAVAGYKHVAVAAQP
jgi:hypothetical protein